MATTTRAKRHTRVIRHDEYGPFVIIKAKAYRPAKTALQHFDQVGPDTLIHEMQQQHHEPGSSLHRLQQRVIVQLNDIRSAVLEAAKQPSRLAHQETVQCDTPPSSGTIMIDHELWVWSGDDPQHHRK